MFPGQRDHVPQSPVSHYTRSGVFWSLVVPDWVTGNSLALDDTVFVNYFLFQLFSKAEYRDIQGSTLFLVP